MAQFARWPATILSTITPEPMTTAELNAAIASGEFKVTRLPRRGPRPGQASMTPKEFRAACHTEKRRQQGWVSWPDTMGAGAPWKTPNKP
jgi:hypothetical protein